MPDRFDEESAECGRKKKENIVRYSVEELAKLTSETDWEKVDATSESDVERQAYQDDDFLPEDWESTVVIGVPEPRQSIHIRVDADAGPWRRRGGLATAQGRPSNVELARSCSAQPAFGRLRSKGDLGGSIFIMRRERLHSRRSTPDMPNWHWVRMRLRSSRTSRSCIAIHSTAYWWRKRSPSPPFSTPPTPGFCLTRNWSGRLVGVRCGLGGG
jgi:hypothetical protein